MHTIEVLTGGFVLLFFCLLVSRVVGGAGVAPMIKAMQIFIPLWFIAAAINLWVGVTQAGYTFIHELPIFFIVFAIPVTAASLTLWRLTHLKKRQ
jgi:hypothetical protein